MHHTSLYNSLPFLHYHDVKMPKAPSTHIRIILKTDFFPSVFKTYTRPHVAYSNRFRPLRMRYGSSK